MTLLPLFGALVSCEVAGVLSPGCPSSPRGLEVGDLASRASGVPSQLPRALGGEHPGNFGATSVGCALFVLTHLAVASTWDAMLPALCGTLWGALWVG